MAFGRHLKALLWKNALLWRRKLCGSLCEIIFPIIMVLSLAGIRKAVSNEDFAAGNRLANGVSYIDINKEQTFFADLAGNIDFEIGPPNYPMRPANGKWYTIVGEDPDRVQSMKDELEPVLEVLRQNVEFFEVDYQGEFKTQDDLFDFVRGRDYQKDKKQDAFLFAIGLPPDPNTDPFNYTIYMSENYPKNIADTKQDIKSLVPGVDNFEAYSVYGYMSLQSFIANYILHDELGDDESSIDVFMSMGSIDDFTQDKFLEVSGGLLALFILLIFIAPLFRLVSFLTEEKASRAREGMKIMGLNDSPYWLSWFIYYFCVNLVISIFTGICFGLILYPKSNIFLIWLYIFLYGLSLFSFAVLVSSFLQRPLIACIVVTLFHFLTYFLSTPIAQPDVGLGVRMIFSMIPNVAMVLSSVAIGQMEATGQGLSGSNLFEEIFTYYIGVAFISFILNFVAQLLLGLYLDNVLPKQYGKRQHPCFMFQKSYWFGTKYNDADGDQQRLLSEDEDDSEINGHHQDFEAVPPNVRQLERTGDCMKVRHLKKIYGDGKVAVNDLSLTMYKNQIFALLGHNGAGKTTTLSILTGLYQPTAGKASVFNLDMFGQVNEVRKNLGVCPQFDILFDMLTPEEHLKLYCMFKGVPVNEVEDQVEKTLKDVDLESKRKAFAKNLSGGQKRKLSVGIAMIGGSKLVLLDEPTSGMDLTARRKIWDMLKNNKQDRIVILTTHFMDEADILGDRIAIMASGKIKCCGESLFLKKRFGVGYNLIIAKEDKEANPAIEEFVFSRIENCIKLSEVSSEVTFQIPQSESAKFEEFFIELDNSLRQLRIKSYGVGVTTLEEVFLKVGHQDEEEAESNSPDQLNHEEEKLNRGATNGINNDSELELDDYSIAEQHEKSVFFLHYYALCVKRFLVSFRQLKTSLFEILIPMIFIVTGLGLANIDFFSDAKPFNLDYSAFPSKNTKYITSATPNDPNLAAYIATLDADAFEISNVDTPDGANIGEKLTNFEKNIFEVRKGYDKEVKNGGNQVLYNLDRTAQAQRCQVIGFSNGYARDGAPTELQGILNSCLRILLDRQDLEFKTVNHPFPLTAAATAGAKAGTGSIVATLFAIAFAMIPTGVAASIVNERESNVKHQQIISGSSMVSYWLSNYTVDFIRSMIPMTFAIIMVFAFSVDLPFIWVHFFLFALAIHPFTYATTFWFKKESVAQIITIIMNLFLGAFVTTAVLVLQSFESTRSAATYIRWFPKIFPSFSVVNGILQISARNILSIAMGKDSTDAALSFEVAGGDALFLGIDIFLWWGVLIMYETGIFSNIFKRESNVSEFARRTENAKIDSDVMAEEMRCADIDPRECSVLVNQLRKEFKVNKETLVAVKNICFGLEYGECFALLGVNGAGKSTTFKSMTGDIVPTDGKIYIDGLDLSSSSQFSDARKLIGYCPQENAIFEGMTVYEHLVFYSRIKGILHNKRADIIKKIMQEMDLEQFKNVRCEKLSGGNKRKLSVAMAMIGNPPIVFLDEPSTGMDPRAKRFMWTIISKISTLRKKSTVILTTHSMEEAEALCTKMGIMVSGRFKCFGSSQDIKDKFGTGFEVEIKIKWPTEDEATKLAREHGLNPDDHIGTEQLKSTLEKIRMEKLIELPQYLDLEGDVERDGTITTLSLCEWALLEDAGFFTKESLEKNTTSCQVLEHYNNFFKFRIERGAKSLGFFFGFMENLKSQINFEEYGVSQTTLEQIFNAFAKGQDVEEGNHRKRGSTTRKDFE